MNGAHFWPVDFARHETQVGLTWFDSHRFPRFLFRCFIHDKKSFGGLVLSMFEELELKDARGCCRDFWMLGDGDTVLWSRSPNKLEAQRRGLVLAASSDLAGELVMMNRSGRNHLESIDLTGRFHVHQYIKHINIIWCFKML